MTKELIIIPDVHGRTFWKQALPYIEDGTLVVFLGDYLDPYPHEGITKLQALDNFQEILEVTKDKGNVTLLFGNHDCTYTWPEANICECRTDYDNLGYIHKIFQKNLRRFRLFWVWNNFLFTHAGVHPAWLKTLTMTLTLLENKLKDGDAEAIRHLADVGRIRGGWSSAGSCVWADIHEFDWPTEPISGYTQIVGHSQQLDYGYNPKFWWKPGKPVRFGNTVCLDCHQCFYIDSEGDIRYLEGDEVVK